MNGRSPIRLLTMIGMALAVAACSGTASSAAPGGPAAGASLGSAAAGGGSADTSAPGGGTDQTSLVAAATKVTDVCTLVATDVAAKVTPVCTAATEPEVPSAAMHVSSTESAAPGHARAVRHGVGRRYPAPGTVAGLRTGSRRLVGPSRCGRDLRHGEASPPDQGGLYVDILDPSGTDRNDRRDRRRAGGPREAPLNPSRRSTSWPRLVVELR